MTPNGSAATDGDCVLSPADRIDLACDDFEAQWRQGPPPAIENFLLRHNGAELHELFTELLLVDIGERQARHDPPTFAEYAERFPDYTAELESIWLRIGRLETVANASTDTPRDRWAAGMRIAQFELVERLGAGGAGEVWKALDTRLQRIVAIKVPRQRQLSADELHRFLREGQAAAQMRHSHLVSVHEVGHDGHTAFIVSDFIEGADLRDMLRRRRPAPRESAQLAADIAEALHHAHEHGVVHRDLKPANVLLNREGQAHVTDFGLAKWTEDAHDMTVDGQILGTPAYMSPEQARGEANRVDRRTDVFALGTLLYEMLTGRRPFEGDQATVMHQIVSADPARPRSLDRSIPRDLETVCLRALEKDPARRYPSAQELAVDLRRYLRGEPILARTAGRLERSLRWIRRRPAVASSIVLAVLAVAALAWVRMFAEENRQLLGLRTVTLTTEPVGARVTFVPLDEVTNELLPDRMIHARTVSPIVEELRPGDYLVVAVLDDGRFHEVIRHVPAKEENLPGAYNHLRWRLSVNGGLELPPIDIPASTVTENMTLIAGADQASPTASALSPLDPRVPHAKRNVKSFYLDWGEVSVAEYRRITGSLPLDRSWRPAPDSHALTMRYDVAMHIAEKLGKRLPTFDELEFAATRGGKSRWPWGDAPPVELADAAFGPVGTPDFDRLADDPRVVGLRSNVAEWTSSSAAEIDGDVPAIKPIGDSPPHPSSFKFVLGKSFGAWRFVAGGDNVVVAGNATVAAEHRAPVARNFVSARSLNPGLGMRCVRSACPRNVRDAFQISE